MDTHTRPYRLVVTVESPNGPAVRGIDNRLARTLSLHDNDRDALQAVEKVQKWWERAQAGQLVSKDMTGAVAR